MSSRAVDLSAAGYGLRTEKQLHINRMLMDLTKGKLSLRRIPEQDPAFAAGMAQNPPKVFGVYEENVASDQSPWVFTLAEMSIDERIIARVLEGDFSRNSAAVQFEKAKAFAEAQRLSGLLALKEKEDERREEMLAIGKLAGKRHTFTHRIGDELYEIGERVRKIEPKRI
jgi:hypothetical protein